MLTSISYTQFSTHQEDNLAGLISQNSITQMMVTKCVQNILLCCWKCLHSLILIYLSKVLFAQWAVWVVVHAALQTLQTECVSTGGGDRLIKQPEERHKFNNSAIHPPKGMLCMCVSVCVCVCVVWLTYLIQREHSMSVLSRRWVGTSLSPL